MQSLDVQIESQRPEIQVRRDEIAGTVQPAQDAWQVPAEEVEDEDEIDDIEHRIRTLTMIRDRLLPGETYLLGRKDLRQAGLMPRRSKQIREVDPEKGIRWVTRAVR